MDDLMARVTERWGECSLDVERLLGADPTVVGVSDPPTDGGVYVFYDEDRTLSYVGIAGGVGGLSDRILRKHVSGDDSHALQQALKLEVPDREKRREYIRTRIRVGWIVVNDDRRRRELEHFLIWLYRPKWNRY